MNKVILMIKEMINNSITKYLPDVKSNDLEDNGTIYYMNGNLIDYHTYLIWR